MATKKFTESDVDRCEMAMVKATSGIAETEPDDMTFNRACVRAVLEEFTRITTLPRGIAMTRHTPTELRERAKRFDGTTTDTDTASMIRQAADDAERLEALALMGEAYGFEDTYEGNRWIVDGPFADIYKALDAARKETP